MILLSSLWDDDRWWYGMEPPDAEEKLYWRDMTPGADDRPHIGIPNDTDLEVAEKIIREMGWGEASQDEDG